MTIKNVDILLEKNGYWIARDQREHDDTTEYMAVSNITTTIQLIKWLGSLDKAQTFLNNFGESYHAKQNEPVVCATLGTALKPGSSAPPVHVGSGTVDLVALVPSFKHDCESCEFVASVLLAGRVTDIWRKCLMGNLTGEYILRFGNEGNDYSTTIRSSQGSMEERYKCTAQVNPGGFVLSMDQLVCATIDDFICNNNFMPTVKHCHE